MFEGLSSGLRHGGAMVESLEGRTLLHNPVVTGVSADNRGEVFITMDEQSSELSRKAFDRAVQMFTAGSDKRLGTADDERVATVVTYTPGNHRLHVIGDVTANQPYRVKIVSSLVRGLPVGDALDGEFNGTFPSGNGVAGGNFEFRVLSNKSRTPTVRMFTDKGQILLKLRGDLVSVTVANFLRYVNSGRYDGTFIHRNGRTEPSPINIIQGGGYDDLENGHHIETFRDIGLEAGPVLNERGVISMARTNEPDSANSEWFINIQDNNFLDPQLLSDGYAGFGTIRSGMEAADAIFAADTQPIGNFDSVPVMGDVPIGVRRVAVVSNVAPL